MIKNSNETITVKELISQLQKVNQDLPVFISMIGFTSKDSYDYPLEFKNESISEYNNMCRINITYL